MDCISRMCAMIVRSSGDWSKSTRSRSNLSRKEHSMPERKYKNAVSVADRIEPQVNRYYLKVSRRYMALGIFLMIALLFYIVCVMLFFGEYVTYDNLKYLVRDWSAMSLPGNEDFTNIVYNGTDGMSFRYFRNGLAVCDVDSFLYYDNMGIQLIDDDLNYANPAAISSDKYLLIYDVGGEEYAVYNQLTQIIAREAEGRIITGDIADDGSLILVTRSRETRFVVGVYNAAFNKTMNIYKENYVLDAAVSPNGKQIIICSAVPAETDFNAEVEICRSGSSERVALMTYEHTMPLDVLAADDGFILLCDNGIYFFDYEGHITKSAGFDGMSLTYADINNVTSAVVGSVNALGSENHVMIFDVNGNPLFDKVIRSRVTGIYASRNADDALAYFTTTDSVVKIMPDGTTVEHKPESGDVLSVIPLDKDALICQKNGAYNWTE